MTYIYTLSDPITGKVKYIGKTINPKDRLKCYIKQAKYNQRNNLVINWVKSLLKKELEPKMEIIDEIEGDWKWLEIYWIAQFKSWGFVLKNVTEGGDDNPIDYLSSRLKESETLKNVPKSQKHKDKLSEVKTGVSIHSNEQKEIYSITNSGIGNPMFGKIHSKESLNKMKRPVIQYTLNDVLVQEWPSAADIERNTNMLARSINRCAKGDRATAYGFKWIYKTKR